MKKNILLHLLCATIVSFVGVSTVFAQTFEPLAPIPGLTDQNLTIVGYLERIFFLAIIGGALLAVVRISVAGFKYMMTDVVTSKSDAREDIKGAFIGLGILLATVIVLTVINPNLLQLDFLRGARDIAITLNDDQGENATFVSLPRAQTFVEEDKAIDVAKNLKCPDGHKPSINGTVQGDASTWDDIIDFINRNFGGSYTVKCENVIPTSQSFRILENGKSQPKTDAEWQVLIDAAADKASAFFNECKNRSGYRAILNVPENLKTIISAYKVECKFIGKK